MATAKPVSPYRKLQQRWLFGKRRQKHPPSSPRPGQADAEKVQQTQGASRPPATVDAATELRAGGDAHRGSTEGVSGTEQPHLLIS